MKRYLAIILLLLLVSGCTTGPDTDTTTTSTSTTSTSTTSTSTTSTSTTTTTIRTFDTVSIATWNLDGFAWGSYLIPRTKSSILTELRKYDILAAQGIPSGFERYASRLMDDLPEYSYISENEYAFLYLRDIELLNHYTSNTTIYPFTATFLIQGYTLDITQLHTNPQKAENEINALLEVRTSNNQIWLGDLNADCYFYDRPRTSKFSWIIPDREDTATGEEHCAYDRIITTYPVAKRVLGYNISDTSITDHYPVSIRLEIPTPECTDVGFIFEMGNLTEPPFTADGEQRSCEWELTETLVGWNNFVGTHDSMDLNKRDCTFKSYSIREAKDIYRGGWNITCTFDCCNLLIS